MIRLSLAIVLLAAPAAGIAQQQTSNAAQQAESGKAVQRIRNVTTTKRREVPDRTVG